MARGKYAHIIDKLPKYLGNEPEYQQKVEAVKRAMLEEDPSNARASVLAEKYADIHDEEKVYDDLLSEVHLRKEAISQLLVDAYEIEGTTSLSLDSGPTVRVQWEPHAQVIDRDLCRLWVLRNGLERELQLPWQTLNKHVKEMLLEGEQEPDGVIASAKSKIVLVKG